MRVGLINEIKEKFEDWMSQNNEVDHLYRTCVKRWQNVFNVEKIELYETLSDALKSKKSGRLWGGEKYSIKAGLLNLSSAHPDLFWTSIRDLYNENLVLDGRIQRFLHHCDVILKEIQKADEKINTHYQDLYSICMLLSFQYPNKYCLYHWDAFERLCTDIAVVNKPLRSDVDRYYKILNGINGILSKDEQWMNLYYSMIPLDAYLGPSLDPAYQLMLFNFRLQNA